MVTINSFALKLDKSLQIYFFCVKRQAKTGFLKDVDSIVDDCYWATVLIIYHGCSSI